MVTIVKSTDVNRLEICARSRQIRKRLVKKLQSINQSIFSVGKFFRYVMMYRKAVT